MNQFDRHLTGFCTSERIITEECVAPQRNWIMNEPNEITGRPDSTWTPEQIAQYEAFKAKSLAEMPDYPYWLDEPRVPFEEIIEELEKLEREANTGDIA
jgi:hypothetical protein